MNFNSALWANTMKQEISEALWGCFTGGSCWSSRMWANFYPCGQFWRLLKGSTSWVGGGRALNGTDLFCPWQKTKDNTDNTTAEKLCRKFTHVSRTWEHLGHSHFGSVMTRESVFWNLPLGKTTRHHTNERRAMGTFFLAPCRTSTEFYFAGINMLFYARSAFVSLKTDWQYFQVVSLLMSTAILKGKHTLQNYNSLS